MWYICTTMSSTTSAGARPRGKARRDALLDAVIRIVAEAGADAVTHRRVAEVADLPLASTTYWFESKDQLLTAALERAVDQDIACLRGFIDQAAESSSDPLELAVDALLYPGDEPTQALRGSLVATYALLVEAARRPALRAVTRRWTDAFLEALTPLLASAGSRDPAGDAELLLGAADGLLIDRLAVGEAFDIGPQLRRLARALVAA
jgi:TetR/AcrR family transcriptional regulator, regulator of biofilm formation and stress response